MVTCNKEIITFCIRGFPGTNRSLMNLEKTTGLSKHFILNSSNQGSLEIKFFINYLKTEKPKLVVFGGWSAIYEVFLKKLKGNKTQFGIYWTSSPGQVDISEEVGILSFLIEDTRIQHKLFANREFALSLSRHINNVHYLPDTLIIPRSNSKKSNYLSKHKESVIISLFSSPFEYKRKNILNCLLAVSMLKDNYILYLNSLSKNKYYRNLLESLNVRYKDLGWMAEDNYQNILDKVDIGLQASFADTFNHVAAEHIIRGIPVITSHMVPVMQNMSKELKDNLIVDNPDSYLEIKEKIKHLIHNVHLRRKLGTTMLNQITKENDNRIKSAIDIMHKIMK